jgi:O-antigen/teichoic acid export membrane protein
MIKKPLYSISFYTLTSIICALLSVCVLPIFTSYLSQKDYGVSSLISSYVLILSPFLGLSAGGFFWIEFFKTKSKIQLSNIYSTYFWFTTFVTALILIIFYLIFSKVYDLLDFNLMYFLLIPFLSYFIEIGEFTRSLFINKNKPISFLIYSVFFTAVELFLSYIFIVYLFHSWEGRILAWLLVLFLQFVVTLIILVKFDKYLLFVFDKAILINLAIFGLPIIFHQIGKFVINQSDRIFISKMVSIEQAGIYSLGYQVGSMILLPIGAFFNYYTPFLYEKLSEEKINTVQIVKTSYLIVLLTMICLLLLNAFTPLFFDIFIDKKFGSASNYVFWVSISYLFWSFYLLFSGILFYYKKTFFLGLVSFVNIVLNLILNYYFIIFFGAIGATYATAISFFIVFVIVAYKSNKILKLPWLNF